MDGARGALSCSGGADEIRELQVLAQRRDDSAVTV